MVTTHWCLVPTETRCNTPLLPQDPKTAAREREIISPLTSHYLILTVCAIYSCLAESRSTLHLSGFTLHLPSAYPATQRTPTVRQLVSESVCQSVSQSVYAIFPHWLCGCLVFG